MPVYKTKNDDSDHRPREKVGLFFTVNFFFSQPKSTNAEVSLSISCGMN